MNIIDKMNAYVRAVEQARWSHGEPPQPLSYPFITISRQTGSGGHSLTEILLEEMRKRPNDPLFQGWCILDAEMCQRILQESKFYTPLESLVTEEYVSGIEDFMQQVIALHSPQGDIHRKLFKTIRLLASFGKVIFIGRGAMCVTQGLPGGIHLRLVAPLSARLAQIMQIHRASEKTAKKMILEQDKARAKLVQRYFRKDIEDPLLYHAVWNTQAVPLREITGVTISMIQARYTPTAIAQSITSFR